MRTCPKGKGPEAADSPRPVPAHKLQQRPCLCSHGHDDSNCSHADRVLYKALGRKDQTEATMCRSIKPLFNFQPPATDEEIRAASLQFVRKLSGFSKPSKIKSSRVRPRGRRGRRRSEDPAGLSRDERRAPGSPGGGGTRPGENRPQVRRHERAPPSPPAHMKPVGGAAPPVRNGGKSPAPLTLCLKCCRVPDSGADQWSTFPTSASPSASASFSRAGISSCARGTRSASWDPTARERPRSSR